MALARYDGAMKRKSPRRLPGRREDGAATKLQILEAAGEVFAEKGFDRATGKEIAERAKSNSAAVNYYYGGIEGLYAEVLVEAHRRMVTYEKLLALAEAPGNASDKLRAFIALIVRTIVGPASSTWALRVLSREILSPSSAFPILFEREILPKKRIVTALVGEILGLPDDHPAVARCLLNIMAPFALLLVGNRQILARFLPGLGAGTETPDAVIEHFQRFAFGGLSAVAAELEAARPSTRPDRGERREAGQRRPGSKGRRD